MIYENLTDWYKGNCDKTLSLQSFEELAQSEDLKDSYLMGEFDVIKVQYQKYMLHAYNNDQMWSRIVLQVTNMAMMMGMMRMMGMMVMFKMIPMVIVMMVMI